MPSPELSAQDDTAQRTELTRVWRDTVEAGLRYYGRIGRLAFEWVEAFVPAVGELRPRFRVLADPSGEAEPGLLSQGGRPAGRTMVVEAEAGKRGLGVFLVENTTAQRVSAPVGVSAFVDGSGREARPAVRFSPDAVTLEPGDQVLVQVAAAVDETLEPEVRYRAEISIPGLSETRIPIVVRRRPDTAPATAASGAKRQAKTRR